MIEFKTKMLVLVLIAILGLSIGYSALNSELSISGDATVLSMYAKPKILSDNGGAEYIESKGIPDFNQIATTDEGMYATLDNDGTSYYFRGTVENNYLEFANYCWRIVRVNGNGTIRLIYDGNVCHANGTITSDSMATVNQRYNSVADRSEYVGWKYTLDSQRPDNINNGIDVEMKTQTDNWYGTNLSSYDTYIADEKYCNDREVGNNYVWDSVPTYRLEYSGRLRTASTFIPTLICNNQLDVYIEKVGLLTVDEIMLAGGKWNARNNDFYLYNGYTYWTMTPSYWNININASDVLCLESTGVIATHALTNTSPGLRPVINLKADIMLEGNGTISNPYEIVD